MAILAVYSSCSNPEGKESAIANAKDEVEVVSTVLSESVPVESCQQSVRQQQKSNFSMWSLPLFSIGTTVGKDWRWQFSFCADLGKA